MFLSKRWRFLWTMVPKLEYKNTDDDECDECESILRFLEKSLELHKAPVLETLCIQLGFLFPVNEDAGKWVANAVDRSVRELDLELFWIAEPTRLPKCLYTCKTVVELTLSNKILIDVPSSACLPSLKILRLVFVVFKDEDSLNRLLSCCSVLARSTVCFGIWDRWINPIPLGDMYRSVQPHILVFCNAGHKIFNSFSFVTSLYLPLKDPMEMELLEFSGDAFSRLQQVVLHPSGHLWLVLLRLILKSSPKLQYLLIISSNGYRPGSFPLYWNQPSSVPRCLSTHLEFFKWYDYSGSEEEKQLMRYILENSECLKEVSVTLMSTLNLEEKEMILKELKSMCRANFNILSSSF